VGTRTTQALATLWILSIVVFLLARITGSPLDLLRPDAATAENREALLHELGLDRPLPVQYWQFLTNLLKGDLGRSFVLKTDIGPLLVSRFWSTFWLATVAMGVALAIAVPLGLLAAANRGGIWDTLATLLALGGMATPTFVSGIAGILIFGVWLGWLPSFGVGTWKHFVLPAITLGWFNSAGILRLLRSSMLDVLDQEYIKFARLTGVPDRVVIWKHALRNALLPVLTFVGFSYGILIAGAIATETVFAWPGMGRLAYDSILNRDFPVLQAITLVWSAIIIAINFMVDILYGVLDPRIRD
jgi:peptide/nickel transport system permease protein